jgi:hypothetical protein
MPVPTPPSNGYVRLASSLLNSVTGRGSAFLTAATDSLDRGDRP